MNILLGPAAQMQVYKNNNKNEIIYFICILLRQCNSYNALNLILRTPSEIWNQYVRIIRYSFYEDAKKYNVRKEP